MERRDWSPKEDHSGTGENLRLIRESKTSPLIILILVGVRGSTTKSVLESSPSSEIFPDPPSLGSQ